MDQLLAMGFDSAQAQKALDDCQQNVESAIEYLLSGGEAAAGGGSGTTSASLQEPPLSSTTANMIHSNISQYSVDDGRSACTCIALTGASRLLQSLVGEHQELDAVLNPEWMQTSIQQGVETYRTLQAQSGNTSDVEHMSAEQALQLIASSSEVRSDLPAFQGHIQLVNGSVRQGILSNDGRHPLGLRALLEGCYEEIKDEDIGWMVVLLTKSPETVLLAFPPDNTKTFLLLDSHPRPMLKAPNAYIRFHESIPSLVESLNRIFPVTNLGPDVPEIMAEMYNTFDLYPFIYRES